MRKIARVRNVAAGVILDGAGRVLLVLESHPDIAPWVPPGGTIEAGETPREAARREIREECGLDCRIGDLIGVYVSRADDLLAFGFATDVESGTAAVPAGGEILGVEWFDPAELPAACPSLAMALVADALAGRRGVYFEA